MNESVTSLAVVQWLDEFAEQGIFTTDDQLTVTSWNRWMERHSARSSAEVVGRSLTELYPELLERRLDEHYREALAGHASLVSHLLHDHLLAMPARVGEHLFVRMPQRARISPLMTDGRIIGTLTVIDDVSERIASEHELRKRIEAQEAARAAAESALRVKDAFLATLSHEIRTPLSAVLGWTRILRTRQLDPQLVARGIEVIDRNTSVQMRMIDDLLDTARMMAGKLRLRMEPVDVVPVAIAALDVVEPAAAVKRVAVTRRIDPTVGRVLGDPDRLQQVLWNLLSNALKFTESGGSIEFALQQVGDFVVMSVKDTGKGITPDFLPFVFDRFRQADPSSSRREGGLGLGLALVKELVALHGGTITADSRGLEKGSTFTVSLPVLSAAADAGALDDEDDAAHGALRGRHVLVVEDEADARDLLEAMLTRVDARVTSVTNVEDALRIMTDSQDDARPDFVVADIGLPGADGYELMRRLRAMPPEQGGRVPAIAVSAYAGAEYRQLAKTAGFHSYLTKPLTPKVLVDAIVRAVNAERETKN